MVSDRHGVFAVIAAFNRKELLREGIEALIHQDYDDLKIMVVDNASIDGTEEYIKDLIDNKKVFYKKLEKNLGSSGGFNEGIRELYKMNPKYVWILDDDTIVHKDSLTKLLSAAKELNDNFGILGSKVLWKDGNLCKMNIQRKTLFKDNNDFDSHLVKITLSSFVSMFIKIDTIERFGLPIEDFFIWTDDWEYSRRISRKVDCYLVNDSIVTHKCNSNMGGSIEKDSKDRLFRYQYVFRNDVYFYKREGLKGILYVFLRQFYYLIKILFSKSDAKLEKIVIVFKNTCKGFNFNPKIEYLDNKKIKGDYNEI